MRAVRTTPRSWPSSRRCAWRCTRPNTRRWGACEGRARNRAESGCLHLFPGRDHEAQEDIGEYSRPRSRATTQLKRGSRRSIASRRTRLCARGLQSDRRRRWPDVTAGTTLFPGPRLGPRQSPPGGRGPRYRMGQTERVTVEYSARRRHARRVHRGPAGGGAAPHRAVEGDVPPDASILDDLYAKLRSLGLDYDGKQAGAGDRRGSREARGTSEGQSGRSLRPRSNCSMPVRANFAPAATPHKSTS